MDTMKLHFDVRDIFRAPRLALSGKKILVFVQALFVGYADYLILTYLSFALAGYTFSETWSQYGLYPCLSGNPAPWYACVVYGIGVVCLLLAINFGCTAVSRITFKQLKGDEFYSSGDAWKYVKKHWHPVVFTSVSFAFILIFFFGMAAVFALVGKIPYVGDFLFFIPYLLYFFGAIFTIYTAIVFGVSFLYAPAIIAAYEEDTMGTVFNSYAITWSQPWRIILYHCVLIPIGALASYIFIKFWITGYHLINSFFGCDWFMGSKLANIVAYASNIVCPSSICNSVTACFISCAGSCCSGLSGCVYAPNVDLASISGTETAAGVILAVFLFLLMLTAVGYILSILSVGETLMFIIFKKNFDDDNILERKDEDDIDEDEEIKDLSLTDDDSTDEENDSDSATNEENSTE